MLPASRGGRTDDLARSGSRYRRLWSAPPGLAPRVTDVQDADLFTGDLVIYPIRITDEWQRADTWFVGFRGDQREIG